MDKLETVFSLYNMFSIYSLEINRKYKYIVIFCLYLLVLFFVTGISIFKSGTVETL